MNDSQRPLHDKTSLGYGEMVETGESSTLPKLNMFNGKYIKFVRAIMENDNEKPILMTWQQIEQMNRKRFGIGFNPRETKVEIAKSTKRTNSYQPNPMRGNISQYHNQRPVQKRYRNFKDTGKGKQHIVSQAHQTPPSRASNLVRTYRNTETGKLVKVADTKKKEEESWYLDSGCSRHMTGNDKLQSKLVKYHGPTITFGDNSKGKTVGKSKIIHDNIIIQDVLLVDNLKYNLISIIQMCDYGHSVEFQKLNCIVKDSSDNIILTGNRYGNTYKVCWNIQSSKPVCLVASNSKSNWIWYNRLNHLNFKTIVSLSKLELVIGLPKIEFSKDKVCSACQFGKQNIMESNMNSQQLEHHNKMVLQKEEIVLLKKLREPFENIEEQHHETRDHHIHFEDTELGQDNMTNQDLEAQVISGNQSNTRLKWSKKHPLSSVIGNPTAPLRTRVQMIKELLHAAFISQEEPKKIEDALADSCWIEAMQEELNQFTRNLVLDLVPRPIHQSVIDTRWVFRNNLNEEGTVIRNKEKFEMSMMGELNFFLGLQVCQMKNGTFISQTKYTKELIKKFGMENCTVATTPMGISINLDKDEGGISVDATMYRGLIGSLLYLTASRPDIVFAVCLCARFQSNPKQSHFVAGKRILRYLKGTQNVGMWYAKHNSFNLIGYSDADYGGCKLDRKSTS
ncbi:uncharacterized protein [Henckelia pumila]|uniref:uncharacterized protein n=1 Tax=Henckelia pumila TaxID=405737 RepID=UPI003C6DD757